MLVLAFSSGSSSGLGPNTGINWTNRAIDATEITDASILIPVPGRETRYMNTSSSGTAAGFEKYST